MSRPAPRVTPVVLSGGAGTRLWPLSTEARPKQFHALDGGRTLIQDTALRMRGSARASVAPPVVICSGRHRDLVHAQLDAADVRPAAVVLEPMGRNTAAAAAVAALVVGEADPEALVLLTPADHLVADPEAFWRAVEAGAAVAAERIVTFGIRPSGPETGYGYIRCATPLGDGVFAVERFFEKPDRKTAEAYVGDGHVWNAGIFLFSPAVLLQELGRWRPDVLAQATESLMRARRSGADVWLDADAFAACPDVSLDYAVMERTDRAAVVPCEIGWADVGSWSELWRHGARDDDGNRVRGEAVLLDSEDCLVWSDGAPVAVLGVRDLVVVATADGVLVAPKDRAQDVRRGLAALKARRGTETTAGAGEPVP